MTQVYNSGKYFTLKREEAFSLIKYYTDNDKKPFFYKSCPMKCHVTSRAIWWVPTRKLGDDVDDETEVLSLDYSVCTYCYYNKKKLRFDKSCFVPVIADNVSINCDESTFEKGYTTIYKNMNIGVYKNLPDGKTILIPSSRVKINEINETIEVDVDSMYSHYSICLCTKSTTPRFLFSVQDEGEEHTHYIQSIEQDIYNDEDKLEKYHMITCSVIYKKNTTSILATPKIHALKYSFFDSGRNNNKIEILVRKLSGPVNLSKFKIHFIDRKNEAGKRDEKNEKQISYTNIEL